jgi:glycosyltransferase involved in cell wall biosynthesis
MNTRRPSISVGLPVYNGERFLRETLNSILTQTFEDFELIISDNASTDGTAQICKDYAIKDPRIRYFRSDRNLGASKNFNRVFELSSGKYFKWISADDVCAPTFLEKCKEVLDEHPEVVLCYPKTTIIDEFGRIVRQHEDRLDLRFSRARDRFYQLFLRLSLSNAMFGLIRSDLLRKTSLLGNYIASDIVLLAELTLYGQFFELPEYLFFRRIHPQAASSDPSVKRQQEHYDPRTVGNISLTSWRHLVEHLRSIRRAPLNLVEKLHLMLIVLKLARWEARELTLELIQALQILKKRLFHTLKNIQI